MIKHKINISIIRVVILIFTANLLSSSLYTQVTDFVNYSYKPDREYIKSYWTSTKKIVTGPLHWKQKQWIIGGSVAIAGTALYFFDDDVRDVFQSNKNNTLDFTSKYIFEPLGSGVYPALLLGGYYVYGLAADNKKARQIALGGTQAFIMAAVTSEVVKQFFHRHRPYQDSPPNPYLWEGPFKGWGYDAFPSGHTMAAFAIASFMSKVYKDKPWIGVLSYGLAAGTGLSRIYDNKHWATDVLIGAALGYAIGQTVYSVMSEKTNFALGISDNGGIMVAYRLR